MNSKPCRASFVEAVAVGHGEGRCEVDQAPETRGTLADQLAIAAQAESLPADLIVMGTRGLTGLKHVVLGSVAERVVRTAPCPVLTVKAAT